MISLTVSAEHLDPAFRVLQRPSGDLELYDLRYIGLIPPSGKEGGIDRIRGRLVKDFAFD
jgi:hypothetical protein